MKQKKNKRLIPERLEKMRDMIRRQRAVRIDEICQELGISPPTARRDLVRLENSGAVRRVHGGAVAVETRLEEPLFDDKRTIAPKEKQKIAVAAANLVNSEETIYLDGGSTVLELARILRDRQDVNIVTNSLRTAIELSGSGPSVTLTGGRLRRRSQTMVGPLSKLILGKLHFDKAFMGTIGLSLKEGMTTTDPDEAYTKNLAMAQSSQVILLADHSKIGKVSFAHAGDIDKISMLITDKKADKQFIKQAKKKQIKIIQE